MAKVDGPFAQALQQIGNDLQAGDPASLADAPKKWRRCSSSYRRTAVIAIIITAAAIATAPTTVQSSITVESDNQVDIKA
jgi:hypothetical protein